MNMEEIYNALVEGEEEKARMLLIDFLNGQFDLKVENFEFQQSEVSLNSFKGVFESGGKRYFFKTHIEQGGQVREYVGAKLLEEVGYSVIAPAFSCEDSGKELLVYPFIEDQSLFDLVLEMNRHESNVALKDLRETQEFFDRDVFKIYEETLTEGRPDRFPDVQQLFYLRLKGPRFEDFYEGASRELADGWREFEELAQASWIVNGRPMGVMQAWLDRAARLLKPESMLDFSIIGHGDAHNGNVFYRAEGFRYFDPAYAGRMDPFLDLTKPLFHNTFARWMYFPGWVEENFEVEMKLMDGVAVVNHNFQPSEVEWMFFDSKVRNVLVPTVELLRERGLLPEDWQERLRSSLMCCPLLTVNLFDESKYSQQMAALGFAMVAEMANLDFNVYFS
ncbi:MAG: phosphotransferase [Candidatus Peregrinibacteria bacterium]|nr:phosphotransferase [Candidatus Peregrinibacteria bacterium]